MIHAKIDIPAKNQNNQPTHLNLSLSYKNRSFLFETTYLL